MSEMHSVVAGAAVRRGLDGGMVSDIGVLWFDAAGGGFLAFLFPMDAPNDLLIEVVPIHHPEKRVILSVTGRPPLAFAPLHGLDFEGLPPKVEVSIRPVDLAPSSCFTLSLDRSAVRGRQSVHFDLAPDGDLFSRAPGASSERILGLGLLDAPDITLGPARLQPLVSPLDVKLRLLFDRAPLPDQPPADPHQSASDYWINPSVSRTFLEVAKLTPELDRSGTALTTIDVWHVPILALKSRSFSPFIDSKAWHLDWLPPERLDLDNQLKAESKSNSSFNDRMKASKRQFKKPDRGQIVIEARENKTKSNLSNQIYFHLREPRVGDFLVVRLGQRFRDANFQTDESTGLVALRIFPHTSDGYELKDARGDVTASGTASPTLSKLVSMIAPGLGEFVTTTIAKLEKRGPLADALRPFAVRLLRNANISPVTRIGAIAALAHLLERVPSEQISALQRLLLDVDDATPHMSPLLDAALASGQLANLDAIRHGNEGWIEFGRGQPLLAEFEFHFTRSTDQSSAAFRSWLAASLPKPGDDRAKAPNTTDAWSTIAAFNVLARQGQIALARDVMLARFHVDQRFALKAPSQLRTLLDAAEVLKANSKLEDALLRYCLAEATDQTLMAPPNASSVTQWRASADIISRRLKPTSAAAPGESGTLGLSAVEAWLSEPAISATVQDVAELRTTVSSVMGDAIPPVMRRPDEAKLSGDEWDDPNRIPPADLRAPFKQLASRRWAQSVQPIVDSMIRAEARVLEWRASFQQQAAARTSSSVTYRNWRDDVLSAFATTFSQAQRPVHDIERQLVELAERVNDPEFQETIATKIDQLKSWTGKPGFIAVDPELRMALAAINDTILGLQDELKAGMARLRGEVNRLRANGVSDKDPRIADLILKFDRMDYYARSNADVFIAGISEILSLVEV